MTWRFCVASCCPRRKSFAHDSRGGRDVSIRTLVNTNAREALDGPAPDRAPLGFHRRLPGYEETPLVDAPGIAAALGVGGAWGKDDASRPGPPAARALGA